MAKTRDQQDKANVRTRQWRAKNPELNRAQHQRNNQSWRARNVAKVKANSERAYAKIKANPSALQERMRKQRERFLRNRYGLSNGDFQALMFAQDGRCKICDIVLVLAGGREVQAVACVDHDHSTGEVRGILCRKCNRGLGWWNDDVALMRRAVSYLARTGG